MILLGGAAFWAKDKLDVDRWSAWSAIQKTIATVPNFSGSRLAQWVEKISGGCEISEFVSVWDGQAWSAPGATDNVYGRPLRAVVYQDRLSRAQYEFRNVIVCHDGSGKEFRVRAPHRKEMVFQVDRAPGSPSRLTILNTGDLRLTGKDISVVLHTPLGDVLVKSLGGSEIEMKISGDSNGNLLRENITVLSGKVLLERVQKNLIQGDQGVLRLEAQAEAELRWEDLAQSVVSKRAATVLPSGVYWDSQPPPANLELNH